MRLEDLNAAVCDLGYQPLSAEQHEDLKAALADELTGWVLECARLGKAAQSWDQLRSALYGASGHCAMTLKRLGLRVPRTVAIQRLCSADRQLRQRVMAAGRRLEEGRQVDQAEVQSLAESLGGGANTPPHAGYRPNHSQRDRSRFHHVYGQKNAVTFEATTSVSGRACLQVEVARRLPNNAIDWSEKLAVQLADHEAIELLAVMRGGSCEASFEHHGSARDKALTVRLQPEDRSFYLNMRKGRDSRGIPIPGSHAFRIVAIIMRVLSENEPGLAPAEILNLVQDMATRFGVAR